MTNLNKLFMKVFSVMLSVMLLNVSAFATGRYMTIDENYANGSGNNYVYLKGNDSSHYHNIDNYHENSGSGGAILVEHNNMSLHTRWVSFYGNSAAQNGGAVAITKFHYLQDYFTDTYFSANSAIDGGAIYISTGFVSIHSSGQEKTDFGANVSTEEGGAIYNNSKYLIIGTETDKGTISFRLNRAGTAGGAIYNCDNAGTEIGQYINFSTNTAKTFGGAIYNGQNGKVEIDNYSKFIDNSSGSMGGAIYNKGNMSIGLLANFQGNQTRYYGGAVYNTGKLTISSYTIFSLNKSTDTSNGKGGAIYNYNGSVTLDSSIEFNENTAREGGAIYNTNGGNFNIGSSVEFSSNTAGTAGGAIYNHASSTSTFTIGNDASFYNNKASVTNSGGAIYNYDSKMEIGNRAVFEDNSAGYGGAIAHGDRDNVSAMIIGDSSRFINNTAASRGGAISSDTNDTFILGKNADFTNNSAGDYGGAIENGGNFIVGDRVEFFSNTATNKSGGAIANFGGAFMVGTDAKFNENTAKESGGAIHNDKFLDTNGTIYIESRSKFVKNSTEGDGGAIYNYGGEVILDGGSSFFENIANQNGGAIYNKKGGEVNIGIDSNLRVFFSTNTAKGSGGAIYNENDGEVNIGKSSKFIDNSTESRGGAIYNDGYMSVDENAEFLGNKTKYYGGAICNSGELIIELYTSFNSNKCTDTRNGRGGAIYNNNGSVTLGKSVMFNENSAVEGGAIYNTNAGTLNLGDQVKFYSNTSSNGGGAIYNHSSSTDISVIGSNAAFNNNKASENNSGGAIYNYDCKMKIGTNAVFDGNTAGEGGAIKHADRDNISTMEINAGARFTNNAAKSRGGAIHSDTDDSFTLGENVSFMKNSAGDYGGAISITNGGFAIGRDVKFSSNVVSNGSGGAIANFAGDLGISYSANFYGNIAKEKGGAIYNDRFSNTYGKITIASNALFSSNVATNGKGGAIYNTGSIILENNGKFINNLSEDGGGAIYNDNTGTIRIDKNVMFTGNASNFAGAIENNGTITFTDGAIFRDNTSEIGEAGAILNNGTLNFVADTCYVEFTGNTSGGDPIAICSDGGTTNLWVSEKTYMMFNDKIEGDDLSVININQSSGTLPTNGIINLNADMSGYKGTVNFYNGTIELKSAGKWFGGDLTVSNSPVINMANDVISEHNFNNLTINNSLNLNVDADLANGEMDTISASNFGNSSGKIKVKGINILSDIDKNEMVEIAFADDVLKRKVESVNKASSVLYNYRVKYDENTGYFRFINGASTKNMGTAASAVSASAGGAATQSLVANQVFASMDGKVSSSKKASIDPSNLYVSAGDQVFDNSGKIERGLWLKPFMSQETVKIGDADVDNNLYGTLAGIDFPLGQDKQVSFYLGYAGSKQEVEDVKSNQTGYVLGATGMMIKDNWYAGLTANVMFNKASIDTDFGTDDVDMNMFSIGAKAGYNFNISNSFVLEPNLTLVYGVVNSQEYETSQGAQIDSQSVNNISVEPQLKAKFEIGNGWQPYGLLGYSANLGSKPTVKAEGVELELDSIDGYVEYGAGVNKDFIGTVWSCYAQVTGRSGGRNGFAGNLGIKYKF